MLAPVLQSRTHFVTTDIDRETQHARERLRRLIGWADAHDIAAHGHVGDAIDPIAGLADELRRYDVDEIVLIDHAAAHANWVEITLLAALRDQAQVPVRELVVEPANTTRQVIHT